MGISIKLAIFALLLLPKQSYCKTLGSQSSLMLEVKHSEIIGSYEGKLHFLIRNDFISIARDNQTNLVTFYEYAHNTHFLRVLDHAIVRYNTDEYHLPWEVPSNTDSSHALRNFLRPKIQQLKTFSHLRFKRRQNIKDKMSQEETNLLVKMSEMLSRTPKLGNNELLQRLHWLIKGCVRVVGSPFGTLESNSASGLLARRYNPYNNSQISTHLHSQSVCKDMRQETTFPGKEEKHKEKSGECFGMCGIDCWCWPWVCGDCCLHKGCLQHDKCCREHNYLSVYCFCPWVFGFNCQQGYHGFPDCMYQ